ncbi:MAG: amidohydrolase family protein, partial [Gammaproteobacteria bacterium]|nr:amidohydrolase family protein [Gammaproteobacteria bacterium]
RYAATIEVDRPEHLVLPGLVNAYTRLAPLATRPDGPHEGMRSSIAAMLEAGITCFCDLGYSPDASARIAAERGMRALIGIPIAESGSHWAKNLGEYLTRALNLRDEYRGHPMIATAFAPHAAADISDATFGRIATLADELDTGMVMALHESRAAVEESLVRHGVRPIERIQTLGLLNPALTAVHMVHANAADMALAQHGGVAVTLCPQSNFRAGHGPPPVASWAATGLRLGLGSGIGEFAGSPDPWTEMRLLALLAHAPGAAGAALRPWDVLAVATRGGAAALGLDAQIGTLERGKWADLCCVDLRTPAMRWRSDDPAYDPAAHIVFDGGRDIVSDVWVAGRHLAGPRAATGE